MRSVVQRVLSASVVIEGVITARCGPGLLLLVGVHKEDTVKEAKKLADRVFGLRIFNDADGKMNLSISEVTDASFLVVSNFTVYGDAAKSRRPSFTASASFEQGSQLFQAFVQELRVLGRQVATGTFGADMKVSLVNDGPVTLIVET